jgi:hypothetical protein
MRKLIPFATMLTIALSVSLAKAPAITYFDSSTVSAAFAKGAVLFDGQGRNYMVHASRREAVYVLDGTATLVTGGTAIDAIRFFITW